MRILLQQGIVEPRTVVEVMVPLKWEVQPAAPWVRPPRHLQPRTGVIVIVARGFKSSRP